MIAARTGKYVAVLVVRSSSVEAAPEDRSRQPGEIAQLKKDRRLQGDPKRRPNRTVAARLENERQDDRRQRGRYKGAGAEAKADKHPCNCDREIPHQDDVPCNVHSGADNRVRHNRAKDGPGRCIRRYPTFVAGQGGD